MLTRRAHGYFCLFGARGELWNQRRGQLDENSNAKIKQNRVLVCAPSNAAVDELMKKIILEFKERCKDKKNPLGRRLTWAVH